MIRLLLIISIVLLIYTQLLQLGAQSFTISANPNDIHFYLYPFASQRDFRQELQLDDPISVEKSDFKNETKTVFIVHGFWSNITTKIMENMVKDAYLESNLGYNYICVDWTLLARPDPPHVILAPFAYKEAVKNFPVTSNRLGEFISFLVINGFISLSHVHIVGYSLGGHIAGYAGHIIQELHNGEKVARISGLDPARPLFEIASARHRLSQDDAEFIDVYHSDRGLLGIWSQLGHANFYPNSGRQQPGCTTDIWRNATPQWSLLNIQAICSHNMVVNIFANSIAKHNYTACLCKPYIDLVISSFCIGCESTVLAGHHCPTSARGQYYFETGEE